MPYYAHSPPAAVGRRLAAYALDWLLSLAVLAALVGCAAVLLLLTSDVDRRDPPDWSLYAAAIMLTAWLPSWFVYTAVCWGTAGFTLGMRGVGVCVQSKRSSKLGLPRAAIRTGCMAAFSTPLLLSPLVVAAISRLRLSDNPAFIISSFALIAMSALACLPPFLGFQRSAWHDLLSGSQVVRYRSHSDKRSSSMTK